MESSPTCIIIIQTSYKNVRTLKTNMTLILFEANIANTAVLQHSVLHNMHKTRN